MRRGWRAPAVAVPSGACSVHKGSSRLPLSGLRWLLHAADGYSLRQDAATTGHAGAAARGVAKGEPTARLARELGVSREQLHTLRQRIQANLNETAPTA